MESVYLTHEGLTKLQSKLKNLVNVIRPEATAELKAAREHGDLSENAEYDAAKENLANIDNQISDLQQKLSRVEILDKNTLNSGEVRILSTVTLVNVKKGTEDQFTLVDPLQSDPAKKRISVKSPIGKGLLGKRVGDTVAIEVPSGEIKYTVKSIELSTSI